MPGFTNSKLDISDPHSRTRIEDGDRSRGGVKVGHADGAEVICGGPTVPVHRRELHKSRSLLLMIVACMISGADSLVILNIRDILSSNAR